MKKEKKMLGKSDAWSTSNLSHRPSKPAYYIADCRISENIEKTSKLSIFAWKVDGYTLDRVTHVCYSAQTIARQKFYTSQMGPNF